MGQVLARHRDSSGIPTARVAIWWFLGSEVMIFGGLVVTYILMRMNHPEWGAEAAHTISAAGAINTMVLLTSSLTAVLAHKAAGQKDHRAAARFIWITVLLGCVFLGVKGYEYSHEIAAGFNPLTNVFWSYYFLMTGLHAAHVVAGMVAMIVIGLGAAKGENLHRVEYVGMYWHLVDVVWIFLFPLLYLAS